MTALEELKIILREAQSPYFTDEELEYYLSRNQSSVDKAAYQCLIIKAEDDSISLPGGLNLPNNRNYWLSLARQYRQNRSCIIKGARDR